MLNIVPESAYKLLAVSQNMHSKSDFQCAQAPDVHLCTCTMLHGEAKTITNKKEKKKTHTFDWRRGMNSGARCSEVKLEFFCPVAIMET